MARPKRLGHNNPKSLDERYVNPIKEFYDISGLTISELARMCELPRQTIVDIIEMDVSGLSNLRIRTVLNIKKHLNIDLFKVLETIYKHNRKV